MQQPSKATIKVSALPLWRERKLLLAQVAQAAFCTGPCFLPRLHKLLFGQVVASCTGCGCLHRLCCGRCCISMFCMLYKLGLGKPGQVCNKPHHY